jgi:hypothetical protein
MPFQFYCPQGHLLQGDESQMGQQSQCPMCGSLFMIPMPQPAPGYQGQPGFQGHGAAGGVMPGAQMPAAPEPEPPPPPPPEPEPAPEPAATHDLSAPQIVRIPCPNGHLLETPSDMFGQQALCPYCNVQFELRYEDSEEYRAQVAEERRLKEEAFSKKMVQWSLYAAGFVVVMLIGMVLWTVFGRG